MSGYSAQSFYEKMMAQQAGTSGSADAPAPAPAEEDKTKLSLSAPKVKPLTKGAVLIFGSTHYAELGKKIGSMLATAATDETPNLPGPHKLLAGFGDISIVYIATGCASGHCVAVGAAGEAFAWGRNESGQLGHNDIAVRPGPTRVAALKAKPISAASTGKMHTVFLTKGGELYACGAAKHGACGPSAKKGDALMMTPIPIPASTTFTSVAAGSNWNLAIDSSGDVWSWGYSEHGVLGNGSDGEFNKADGAVKLSYSAEPTPKRIVTLQGLKCINVACGNSHCAAISSEGVCYTWGNGNYGCLGHKDQNAQWRPKALEECRAQQVSCGAAHTAIMGWPVLRNGVVCTGALSLYMCGRVKAASQNAWMYPKPEDELRGWALHAFSVGAAHNVVHADDAVISWGSGCACGELGLGANGKKSSANPAKVDVLDGVDVAQVACGPANTMLLVESAASIDKLPEFTPSEVVAAPAPAEAAGGKGKGKGKGKAGAGKRAAEPAAAGKAKKSK